MKISVRRDLRWNVYIEPEGETWPVVTDPSNPSYRYRLLSLTLTVHQEELDDGSDHTGNLKVWTGVRIKADGSEGARTAVNARYLPPSYVKGSLRNPVPSKTVGSDHAAGAGVCRGGWEGMARLWLRRLTAMTMTKAMPARIRPSAGRTPTNIHPLMLGPMARRAPCTAGEDVARIRNLPGREICTTSTAVPWWEPRLYVSEFV